MSINCPACGNHTDNKFFSGSERMFGRGGEFPYCECAKCQAVFIIEIPVDLGSYYAGDYYSFQELVQSVPVTNGQVWKKEREFWFQLDAPRHLFIPNTKSIGIVAEKFSLELYQVEFSSLDNQFWGTELYKTRKPFVGMDIVHEFSKEQLDAFARQPKQFNAKAIVDQACFYLRKN